MTQPDWDGLIKEFDRLTAQTHQALTALLAENDQLRATIARIEACVSSAEQRPETWSFRDFVEWLRAALKAKP